MIAPARSSPPRSSTKLIDRPDLIHTILTDDDIKFAERPRNRDTARPRQIRFDMIRKAGDLELRLIKPSHPMDQWANSALMAAVERMNRAIKAATVRRVDCESHNQLRSHLADFKRPAC